MTIEKIAGNTWTAKLYEIGKLALVWLAIPCLLYGCWAAGEHERAQSQVQRECAATLKVFRAVLSRKD